MRKEKRWQIKQMSSSKLQNGIKPNKCHVPGGDKAMLVAAPGHFLHLTLFILKQPKEKSKQTKSRTSRC